MAKILHLTLYRKWFIQILKGEKKIEYRNITPYWTKRLFDEFGKPVKYNKIFFRNGYAKDCPKMMVKVLGISVENKQYAIQLGDVLETTDVKGILTN